MYLNASRRGGVGFQPYGIGIVIGIVIGIGGMQGMI